MRQGRARRTKYTAADRQRRNGRQIKGNKNPQYLFKSKLSGTYFGRPILESHRHFRVALTILLECTVLDEICIDPQSTKKEREI